MVMLPQAPLDPALLTAALEIGKAAAIGLVALGGIKAGMNGVRADVASTKVTVEKIHDKVADHGERLAVLEATQPGRKAG